jgi:hypothetical protein
MHARRPALRRHAVVQQARHTGHHAFQRTDHRSPAGVAHQLLLRRGSVGCECGTTAAGSGPLLAYIAATVRVATGGTVRCRCD